MKVLVINLLRLGDVIMNVPVINGLSQRRKDAQIDMLTFKSNAALHSMLPQVRQWWTLDRDELQAGMGRADLPLLTSFAVLQEQLDAINAEKYDLIINLSQTHFSAWVSGYLKSADRLGLTYDLKGSAHFYSPWFRYLDEHAESDVSDVFHHTDIFAHACGLGDLPRDWTMTRSLKGMQECLDLHLSADPIMVLQLFTSDEKKNWPLADWIRFVRAVKQERPTMQIVALGAPHEKERIADFIHTAQVDIKPAILSLDGALALLHRSEILVTGDTSIKHLANASPVKVVELCLGWSDWRRTGIFKPDSLILRPIHEVLPVKVVLQSVCGLLNNDWQMIKETAAQFATQVKIRRSRELTAGFWFGQDLHEQDPAAIVATLVERCAWKITLNRERQNEFEHFGSEGVTLRRELRELIPQHTEQPVLAHLDFLEKQESDRSQAVNSELNILRRERPARLDLTDIASFRKRQIALEFAHQHLQHKTKLIRTLRSNWTECL